MPEPIYSSEQTEGLSYSYFMILLPEGIFYHNCAGIVAFIKEKKKEGNYIAHRVFHFWWVVLHTTGAQRQACTGKPSDLPMALGGLNTTRVILPILPSPVCLNGKGGWWLCAARWGVFRGSPRRQQREWSSTRCPEPKELWMLSSRKPSALLQDGTGGRVRKKIRCFFLRITTPLLPQMGCVHRGVAHLSILGQYKLLSGGFYPSWRAKVWDSFTLSLAWVSPHLCLLWAALGTAGLTSRSCSTSFRPDHASVYMKLTEGFKANSQYEWNFLAVCKSPSDGM